MSIKSPNQRPPCGQSNNAPPPPVLGGCGELQNRHSDIKIKYNNTKMYDYHTATCHNFVDPFATLPEVQYTPFCVPDYQCGDCTNDENWCYTNTDPSYFYHGDGTGSVSFEVAAIWNNTYSQSNDTASAICKDTRKLGFKNVYATKCWQGIHSYTSNVWQKPDGWDWCCDGCAKKEQDLTVDKVKYRTISAYATWDVHGHNWPTHVESGDPFECCTCIDGNCNPCTCGDDGCPSCGTIGGCSCQCYTGTDNGYTDYGGAASSTDTVDIYGNHIGTCASSSYGAAGYGNCAYWCGGDTDCYNACVGAAENELASKVFGMLGEGSNNWTALISIFAGQVCGDANLGVPYSVEGSGGTWTLKYQGAYECLCYSGCGCCTDGPGTYDRAIISISPNDVDLVINTVSIGGHFYDVNYCSNDGYCKQVFQKSHDHWSFSATSYDHTHNAVWNDYSPSSGYNNYHVHADLSDPYTSDQVYQSIVTLLGTWDFGSEAVYPWRRSSNKTLGPWVHYDEQQSSPSIGQWCNTGSQPHYTGRIVGAPGPEGIDRIWNPTHPNICVCDDPNNPGNFCQYVDSYGAWSSECEVPRATDWLDIFQSNNLPDGALCGANFMWTMPCVDNSNGPSQIHDDVLWACKYAEVIFPKQSFNYFRPCGIDRITASGSLSWCATASISSSVIALQTPMDNFGSEPIMVKNVGDIADGVYHASWGGDTITLTGTVASQSWLATSVLPYAGTGCVARLQWPGLTTGVCGRTQVLTATRPSSSFPYTCSVEDASYWFNNDKVQITNCAGGLNLNGTWTVTPIDATTIVLQGSQNRGSATYFGRGELQNLFSPNYSWDDTSTKNDFQSLQWLYNYRDIGEWYRVSGNASWNSGLGQSCCPSPGCGNSCPPTCDCPQPAVPPHPRQNQCGLDENVATMSCDTKCVPLDTCGEAVAYFSPNVGSESFANGINLGFKNPGIDGNYTSLWQGMVKQSMDDPLWVAPPCPCEADTDPNTEITSYDCYQCSWQMDQGFCENDQAGDPDLSIPCLKFYPHVPQFEARCEPPPGAGSVFVPTSSPSNTGSWVSNNTGSWANNSGDRSGSTNTPPGSGSTGTTWPFATTQFVGGKFGCVTTKNPDCNGKNVCWAPWAPGTFPLIDACGNGVYMVYVYENPWQLLLMEEGCVCANGRFATEYAANGITCLDPFVDPP